MKLYRWRRSDALSKNVTGVLWVILIFAPSVAFAANHECNPFRVVEESVDREMLAVDVNTKEKLQAFTFEVSDPLSEFPSLERSVDRVVARIRRILAKCEPEDQLYVALFSNSDWGRRTVIAAMSQVAQGSHVNLQQPMIGFVFSWLNERSVPEPPGSTCRNPSAPRSAEFTPGETNSWFRRRILMWTKCSDQTVLVYLPELGWLPATKAQKGAIEASHPGFEHQNPRHP